MRYIRARTHYAASRKLRIIIDRPFVKCSPGITAIKVTPVIAIRTLPELAIAPIARRVRLAEQLQIADCRKWIPREKGTVLSGVCDFMPAVNT